MEDEILLISQFRALFIDSFFERVQLVNSTCLSSASNITVGVCNTYGLSNSTRYTINFSGWILDSPRYLSLAIVVNNPFFIVDLLKNYLFPLCLGRKLQIVMRPFIFFLTLHRKWFTYPSVFTLLTFRAMGLYGQNVIICTVSNRSSFTPSHAYSCIISCVCPESFDCRLNAKPLSFRLSFHIQSVDIISWSYRLVYL